LHHNMTRGVVAVRAVTRPTRGVERRASSASRGIERVTSSSSSSCAAAAFAMTMMMTVTLTGAPCVVASTDEDPIEPFSVYGAVEKSFSVNVMDEGGTKIVGRKRGVSAEACVNVIAASRENGKGLPPSATRPSACERAVTLGEIKDSKDILRACAPACRAACEKGLDEYEEEQRRATGFGIARVREKVRKACVVTCGKDCAKAGKSYDFIIPFRFD
jgi:hypothetical protein